MSGWMGHYSINITSNNIDTTADLYSTASDSRSQMIPRSQVIPKMDRNDPRPQVIPKVDRKWSRKKNRNGLDSSLRIIVSILLLSQKVALKTNNYIKTKWKNFFQDFVKSNKSEQKINFQHTVIKTWILLSQKNTVATHRSVLFSYDFKIKLKTVDFPIDKNFLIIN